MNNGFRKIFIYFLRNENVDPDPLDITMYCIVFAVTEHCNIAVIDKLLSLVDNT